jgi:phosphoglycolate phosphatase
MFSNERLIVLDADGTTIDAFAAIEATFARHGMDLGGLERFQKRRNLFKYLGGAKELPNNLKKQIGKRSRAKLIATLTEVYREEAALFPGLGPLLNALIEERDLRVGIVTRNITDEPVKTLVRLFRRNGVQASGLDFLVHLPLRQEKTHCFREARERYRVNPARSYACGDEGTDFLAAVRTGMHPFIVSYGFEDHGRLTGKLGVPPEVISRTPEALRGRVVHALGIGPPAGPA